MSSPMGVDPVRSSRRSSASHYRRPWESALEGLEFDVAFMEKALAEHDTEQVTSWTARPWQPPADLGPIPEDLRVRAARLLQRQLAVAEGLIEQATQSKKQRDVAARMTQALPRAASAYIDQGL